MSIDSPVPRAAVQIVKLNKLAIVSIVLAVLAATGMALGGIAVIAVFAVGAGHVALHQIRARGERGTALAYTALGLSYAIASYGLLSSVTYFVAIFTSTPVQFPG